MKRIPWWVLMVIGWVAIAASFPAERLFGIALSVLGIALVWAAALSARKGGERR